MWQCTNLYIILYLIYRILKRMITIYYRRWRPISGITVIVIGAGDRGNIYSSYSLENPDKLKIVGVCEPDPVRRKLFSEKYHIKEEFQFIDYKELFKQKKLSDALFICTQDRDHLSPFLKAIEKKYHIF